MVGGASDGAQAIELARSLRPDVVVMDFNMPGTNGIDATRDIVREEALLFAICKAVGGPER